MQSSGLRLMLIPVWICSPPRPGARVRCHMSTSPESELDLDLQLLPAWARQSSTVNRYAKYEGETGDDRRGRRGGPFGPRGDRPPRRDRPPGSGEGRPQGADRGRPGGPPGRSGRPPRYGARGTDRRDEPAAPPVPLPDVNVNLVPEDKGVESLARQIKLTGRSYALFDIAQLILRRPDRFDVDLSVVKNAEGKVVQPLFVCSLDESVWLSEDELVGHVLRQHFDTFYQTEKVATEPPKGTYTLVAQCGVTGVILGPPNLHDYQEKLRRLHAERVPRMPFEVYRNRVQMVRDEAVVKRWVEEQSWKLQFIALNVPEALRFDRRDDVEQHFRQTHLANLIRTVESHRLRAGTNRVPMTPALNTLIRRALEDQRRFPLRLATTLSQQFAGHGLQFFKVNRTVTHVCVARPHYLDMETTVVSEGVRRIVQFVNEHPGCTRRKLLDALAPSPPVPPAPPAPPPPAPAPATPAVEAVPGAEASGEAAPASVPAAGSGPSSPTPEQTAVISDLHWLIHQGHVLEFSDGHLETAKAPRPKPEPKPEPKPAAPTGPSAPAAAAVEPVVAPAVREASEFTTPPAATEVLLAEGTVVPSAPDPTPGTRTADTPPSPDPVENIPAPPTEAPVPDPAPAPPTPPSR